MKVRWTDSAEADVREIGRFIARDDRRAALAWIERLTARVEALGEFPSMGRIVPEFGRVDVRELLVDRYRVVYVVRLDAVELVAVREGHRILRSDLVGEHARQYETSREARR